MSKNLIRKNKLRLDKVLYDFLKNEALPGTGLAPELFWAGFSELIENFGPRNKELLNKRKLIQEKLNEWHLNHRYTASSLESYKEFLYEIEYLVPEGDDFQIETINVDPEIADISGPQLVVPITNARYAINAANARWGSLYDAVYGTDVMGDLPNTQTYDTHRGARVTVFAKSHLDQFAPLVNSTWAEVSSISVVNNQLHLRVGQTTIQLLDQKQYVGYQADQNNKLSELVLIKNNIHCRILINSLDIVGKNDPANISDILIEAAISTIMDCEDSVATVDADDKVTAYRNWLGLMKGNLSASFKKNGVTIKRNLEDDIKVVTPLGSTVSLKGRSLLLIRNVGHLMTTSSIIDNAGDEIGEGLMDAVCTSLIALHDINRTTGNKNSLTKSVYIVKPKMHGPEEVNFINDVFNEIEKFLQMPLNTIKIGIMDEERRTSVNLKECIREAKSRIAFINTGFLDRTGDEIHTSMEAGPMLPKADMKASRWINAYENRNVDIGLACGFKGRAQIGKGMWAMPDLMAEMLEKKINHPKEGANCAWVPSPTAAIIHALHYHLIDVKSVQLEIEDKYPRTSLDDLLCIPVLNNKILTPHEIENEIRNNAQGILGYVVRWIDQGVGCSKVPDTNNIGLMEDRATCRISSQALANWMHHGIISKDQVMDTMKEMASLVDQQNNTDENYTPMSTSYDTIAFKTACDLVFSAINQPSGYTEPILHFRRGQQKSSNKIITI